MTSFAITLDSMHYPSSVACYCEGWMPYALCDLPLDYGVDLLNL